jgi:putative ABC transport system permease protein
VVLLTGAGLLINSLIRLSGVDARFNPNGLTTFQMNFTGQQFFHQTGNVTPSGSLEFELTPRIETTATDIRERLRGGAGRGSGHGHRRHPAAGGARRYNFTIQDGSTPASENSDLTAQWVPIAPDYFSVIQAPVLRGREFTENDRRGAAPVVLINATMAKKYWPDGDPIGKTIAVQFFNDVPAPDCRRRLGHPAGLWQHRDGAADVRALRAVADDPGRTYRLRLEVVNFLVRTRAPLESWLPAPPRPR